MNSWWSICGCWSEVGTNKDESWPLWHLQNCSYLWEKNRHLFNFLSKWNGHVFVWLLCLWSFFRWLWWRSLPRWPAPSPPSWCWMRMKRPRSRWCRCTGTLSQSSNLTRLTVRTSEFSHKKSTWLSSNISHHMPVCETLRSSGLMSAPLSLCFVLGVQFMWDCCCESVTKIEKSAGSGCILAHCMGLGKTLQVLQQRESSMPFCCLW